MTKKQIDTILSSNIPKRWNTSQSYVISNEHGTIEIMSRAACEGLAMMVDEMKANNNSVCIFIIAAKLSINYPQHINVTCR